MDRIAEQVRALARGADNTTRKTILDSLRDLSLSLETPHDTLQRICYTVRTRLTPSCPDLLY
jgi:demethylsterigmatocystin 6-O-methyltransferase